jgi:integrase/recombinase XerD
VASLERFERSTNCLEGKRYSASEFHDQTEAKSNTGATAFPNDVRNVAQSYRYSVNSYISYQREGSGLTTLSEALSAYTICAKAEGRSPKTIRWVTSSVAYFGRFLGRDPNIDAIRANDLRRFIIMLQDSTKYLKHPFNKPQQVKLSSFSIETYARGIRAFFGFLKREGFLVSNPMEIVKMPKVPQMVVPTFSALEMGKLISMPDRSTPTGFRYFLIILTLFDTTVRVSELSGLEEIGVDFENGYLKVMEKGGK